jgi:putative transposase
MVITPNYRGKVLVEKTIAVEGIIRKTCKEMKIEIIDLAVNVNQVHPFIEYTPKYSVRIISKKIKGKSSRILGQNFPYLKEWCNDHLWAPGCCHGYSRVTDGELWGSTSRRKIMRERTNHNAQALYLVVAAG